VILDYSEAMPNSLQDALQNLSGQLAKVSFGIHFPEPDQASIQLIFADGTLLEAAYWRIIKDGKASISSFDHGQQYGLPAPIDAIDQLRTLLEGKHLQSTNLEGETGDLTFFFEGPIKLQIFNFTGYEIWEMRFPNGTVEYSNYCK
jgi:hypothetical protein